MELQPTSIEYLKLSVTVDVPLTMDVDVVLLPHDERPTAGASWTRAQWQGPVGTTRVCRVLAGGRDSAVPSPAIVVPAGTWWPWVRLVDDPEVIVARSDSSVVGR